MDITPLIHIDQQVIQGYGEGRFRVNGTVYEEPVIVMPSGTHKWAVSGAVAGLKVEDFAPISGRADEFDVVLFGSGKTSERLDMAVLRALKQKGLNIECMDTGAACRTYNVLMAEGRRVAAALLPV